MGKVLDQFINKIIKMTDAFCGKYIVDKRDGYDEFMKGIGVPDEYIEKGRDVKVETEIVKKGDGYDVTRVRPLRTITNHMVVGKECEFDTIKGDVVKATVNFADGKLTAEGPEYKAIMWMEGDVLVEKITLKGHTLIRYNKKQ